MFHEVQQLWLQFLFCLLGEDPVGQKRGRVRVGRKLEGLGFRVYRV